MPRAKPHQRPPDLPHTSSFRDRTAMEPAMSTLRNPDWQVMEWAAFCSGKREKCPPSDKVKIRYLIFNDLQS